MIGNDARYLEIIQAMANKGYRVLLIGFNTFSFNHSSIQFISHTDIDFFQLDAIILPIQGVDKKGGVTLPKPNEKFMLTKNMIDKTPKHCTIYTGIANSFLTNISVNRKLEVILNREDIAVYNAIPTAEGTLQLALKQTDKTIHGMNIIILGFGNIGITIANLFKNVGGCVSVAVRNKMDMARINEWKMKPIDLNDLKKNIHKYSLCINTIPARILDSEIISSMNVETCIIDLASADGGTDFNFAKQKGITAIHALGLPEKTAPKTAGKIITQAILPSIK